MNDHPPTKRRSLLAAGLAACLAVVPLASQAEFRKFTSSTGGKTILAELVHALGDGKVKIRRDDGTELTVKVTAFSAEDQAYINEWIKTSPLAIDYNFVVEIEERKQDRKRTEDYSEKMQIDKTGYEVAITNRARSAIEGVTVKYKVFMEDRVSDYGSHRKDPELLFKEGEAKLPKLGYNRTGKFQTKTHTVQKVHSKYSFYDRSKERDRMKGMWIQFYMGGELVDEWKSKDCPVSDFDFNKKKKGLPGVTTEDDDPPERVNAFKP